MCAQSTEEKQNTQNAGLEEDEETRPESSPLLQETQGVVTKGSALEDEDRGLGDSLPNTTSSSQTSLSAVPTTVLSGAETPEPSPPMMRPKCSTVGELEHWSRVGDALCLSIPHSVFFHCHIIQHTVLLLCPISFFYYLTQEGPIEILHFIFQVSSFN